ncbi:MAG: four helix bundle protein [Planctomycetes bacterium]|nr:four helix bundle protein [Planctomycetota bacterium]
MARDHRKLRAFELADELALSVYQRTRVFPDDERYGLTSQIRRAAVSVAANIVEGAGRDSEPDFVRFLHIALASLREVGYYIDLARRLNYLGSTEADSLKKQYNETASVLHGLIKSFKRSPK